MRRRCFESTPSRKVTALVVITEEVKNVVVGGLFLRPQIWPAMKSDTATTPQTLLPGDPLGNGSVETRNCEASNNLHHDQCLKVIEVLILPMFSVLARTIEA